MTPRRKQFFRMVSEGLKVGFEGEDLSRVDNFVRYCKGELAYQPLGPLHQVGFGRCPQQSVDTAAVPRSVG